MEEIKKNLTEIVNIQLEKCKKKKTIPSNAVLDIVKIINSIEMLKKSKKFK